MLKLIRRLIKEKPLGAAGALIVLILLLAGIFADVLAPYGYNEMSLMARLKPPSAAHPFGTDNVGRDMLSRVLYGARISMIVGLSAASISTVISTILGAVSGYFGGAVDFVIMRMVDGIMCIPSLVLMMTVIAVTGPGMVPLIVILGVQGGIGGRVRVVRSAVLSIRKNLYIEAAQAIGVKSSGIIRKHIFPNITATVIVMFTQAVGNAIISEATLSFLGLGIQPPMPSWGSMLSLSGRSYMLIAPWMAFWPGFCLCILVYGINVFGDALRDLLDPRLKNGVGTYALRERKRGFGSGAVSGLSAVWTLFAARFHRPAHSVPGGSLRKGRG